MAKTLRVNSAAGFITKGAPLLNSELDQNFIDLYTDILTRVQKSGDTLTGKLVFAPSTTAFASANIASGTAPTSPIDGDIWVSGINGVSYRLGVVTKTLVFSDGTFTGTVNDATFIGNTIGSGNTWQGNGIDEVYGGTGVNSYITGDTLYASATNTLSKLPIGMNGQIYTVVGGLPAWADVATSIIDNNTATEHFLLFTLGTGDQEFRIDSLTTPLSYIPSTGVLNLQGGLTSSASTVSIYNTNVTTANLFGAMIGSGSKIINIGAGGEGTSTTIVTIGTNLADSIVDIQGDFTVNGVPFSGGAVITDDITTNATFYPTLASMTTGSFTTATVSSTKLNFNPSTGQLQATSFNALSDANKKENVVTVETGKVDLLRGVEFTWKDNGQKSSGVIAQEVEAVLPHLVYTDENGKSVNYDGLIAYLIEEIKELKTKVLSLEGK